MSDGDGFILTKIIATLGPATDEIGVVVRLIEEGARVFRINFSHGGFGQFVKLLEIVRSASDEVGVPVAVLGDLSGPKIRVANIDSQRVVVETGQRVAFQAAPAEPTGDPVTLTMTDSSVLDDIEPGERLLIDDGAVRMLVMERADDDDGTRMMCRVTVGGPIGRAKGINLPDSNLTLPSLTDHDRRCVDWALEHEIDYLALSFVRRAEEIRQLRALLDERAGDGGAIPIVAKIEKPQALDDLENITREADAVMVARGDLGVEMDLAKVPIIQKHVIAMAHDYGRPVIVATQMLQSMIEQPTPTRAEVSDVANAIYDGADAVMLSGETAIGRHPIQALAMMARVARLTVDHLVREKDQKSMRPSRQLGEGRYRTAALARGVAAVVEDLDAHLVVTWSQRGGGARYLSKNRLTVPIIAASSEPRALRRMSLLFGVVPIEMPMPAGREAFANEADRLLQREGWAQPGDPIVLVAGKPLGVPGLTNTLWVRYVGDEEDEMGGEAE